MKKLFCIVLSVLILLGGCASKPDEAEPTDAPVNSVTGEKVTGDETLSLAYNKTEGLSPLSVKSTENSSVIKLVYDSLFTVDDTFTVENCLADTYTYVGNVMTIKLKNVKFHNGKTLTAQDVIYTMGLLSGTKYGSISPYIDSVEAFSDTQMTIHLNKEISNLPSLMNFPILSSDKKNNNGTGRYVMQADTLTRNTDYYGGVTSHISTITLHPVETDSERLELFLNGDIDFIFSDTNISYADIDTLVTVDKMATNTLTYIGLNAKRGKLSNAAVRRALSTAINRNNVAKYAQGGACYVTYSQVNPKWFVYTDAGITNAVYDSSPKQMLSNAGATNLTLSLAVNSDNFTRVTMAREIANELEKIGVTVNVQELDYASYRTAAASGNYDMYIGQSKLQNNMDLSPLMALATGYTNERLNEICSKLAPDNLAECVSILDNDTPLIPLLFDEVQIMAKNTSKVPYCSDVITVMNYK